ncbi:uncharacterized protein [Blastocystis hominis]|uniref:Uncharacterized protein n=1 Tax=Blastocystis hominis TaxID=12968 RepID=D8LUY4_BLAHO|nr:uncharacterized protein [Blastocystis hominis]CBK19623.2 unnamed protein product [Blastocystis hominis]|eukprot:XP_012893671.1 uncharacterized protein [Blastocystis hominis]
MHHSSTEDISISLLLYPFDCSALLVSTESFAFKCHNFPRLLRSMETNLVEENKQLRKRVIELESQVASLQETLDKYKESCRFQLQQLKEYNDSLKEQLRAAHDGFMTEQDEPNEITTEEAETFKNLVFSPEVEKKHNILCVVPWERNSNYIFSTDVTKRLVCISLDDNSIVSEVPTSAPCCSLVLVRGSKYLLAGCMDGMVHIFQIDSENYIIKKLTKIAEKKLHEKAILRFKKSENLNIVLSTSYDNTVAVWDIKEDGALHEVSRYYFKYTVDGIAIAPSHHTIILAERNQPFLTYIDWRTQAKKEVSINQHEWDMHVSFCITDCVLMGDERYVVALTDKSNVIVFPACT